MGYDNPFGTTRALDLLGRDRELLHTLRANAHRPAAAWPDWASATRSMAAALEDLVSRDDFAHVDTVRQLVLEIDGITGAHLEGEAVRRERDELRATLNLVFGSRGWKALERARHLLGRT